LLQPPSPFSAGARPVGGQPRGERKTWVGARGATLTGLHHAAGITRHSKLYYTENRSYFRRLQQKYCYFHLQGNPFAFFYGRQLPNTWFHIEEWGLSEVSFFSFVWFVPVFCSCFSFRTLHCFLKLLQ